MMEYIPSILEKVNSGPISSIIFDKIKVSQYGSLFVGLFLSTLYKLPLNKNTYLPEEVLNGCSTLLPKDETANNVCPKYQLNDLS